jgi:CheY-like chemotaxis protein
MQNPKRILVIDDQDDIREIAALSLESGAGWQTISAASGKEGLQRALDEQPDAILLDVMMPGMDGHATLAQLRRNEGTRDIPVIFLTAKTRIGSDGECAAQGVIFKPFDPITLADDIAVALGWKNERAGAATVSSSRNQ